MKFIEETVICGLNGGCEFVFISDHLMRTETRTTDVHAVARAVAERNDLRYRRVDDGDGHVGYEFRGIE